MCIHAVEGESQRTVEGKRAYDLFLSLKREPCNTKQIVTQHAVEQQCQNYRTISLIGHPSLVMLKIILTRLKPQAQRIIAEEQVGFRAGRSTTEQIFNL